MLPKNNRLSKKEILELLPKAKAIRGTFLFLKFKTQNKTLPIKAGVSISKKVAKSAVQRNKFRRIIYRVLAKNKKEILSAQLFFVINKIATRKEIENEAVALISSAKLI